MSNHVLNQARFPSLKPTNRGGGRPSKIFAWVGFLFVTIPALICMFTHQFIDIETIQTYFDILHSWVMSYPLVSVLLFFFLRLFLQLSLFQELGYLQSWRDHSLVSGSGLR
jgi:hypothetical protein